MPGEKSQILEGTFDLMVLQTLESLMPLHGYGIARRIEEVSEHALQINQGTIYVALVRLLERGWISSKWGTSENNRRAKFYSITKAGKKQLIAETRKWDHITAIMDRVLQRAE